MAELGRADCLTLGALETLVDDLLRKLPGCDWRRMLDVLDGVEDSASESSAMVSWIKGKSKARPFEPGVGVRSSSIVSIFTNTGRLPVVYDLPATVSGFSSDPLE